MGGMRCWGRELKVKDNFIFEWRYPLTVTESQPGFGRKQCG